MTITNSVSRNISFRPVENPYIAGDPIKGRELFFGRRENFSELGELIRKGCKVILLKGGRRSGKTSILYQICNGHRKEIKEIGESVLCDIHQIAIKIKKDEDLPCEICKAIVKTDTFQEFHNILKNENDTWDAKLLRLVKACLEKISPRRLILLFDEYESLENLFKSGVLTKRSLMWVNALINSLPVSVIMTGSHIFGENLAPVFAPVCQIRKVSELSEQDARELIIRPVQADLYYPEEIVERICHLSGRHPFYIQFICQHLVNHINKEKKRSRVEKEDVEKIVSYIMGNPPGHIQATWNEIKQNDNIDKSIQATLAALANDLNDPDCYAVPNRLIKTGKKCKFYLSAEECYSSVTWLKENTDLIERQESGRIRFQIDIFRHWIRHNFQTGCDIEGRVIPKENALFKKIIAGVCKVFAGIISSFPSTMAHSKSLKMAGVMFAGILLFILIIWIIAEKFKDIPLLETFRL